MSKSVLYIVDDDVGMREAISWLAGSNGIDTETYENAEDFLSAYETGMPGCLLADIRLPEMDGLTLAQHLQEIDPELSAIVITGHASIRLAVDALKGGALDFIEKPIDNEALLNAMRNGLALSQQKHEAKRALLDRLAPLRSLTLRERDVFEQIVLGHTSKVVGDILNISQKTVETHRASIMKKTGAHTLSDLIALHKINCNQCAG